MKAVKIFEAVLARLESTVKNWSRKGRTVHIYCGLFLGGKRCHSQFLFWCFLLTLLTRYSPVGDRAAGDHGKVREGLVLKKSKREKNQFHSRFPV